MADYILLAPGPSMSQELADSFKGQNVGVIGNCYELAPWANFLCANDLAWWKRHPEAKEFKGRKFSAGDIPGVMKVKGLMVTTASNSGVVALEIVRQMGAKRVLLYGFDMHGTHFFGPYTNGCKNTETQRRELHQKQYWNWSRINKQLEVINMTKGSQLQAYPCAL